MVKDKDHDELLDLVDDSGSVIGQEWRSVVYKKGMNNYRVVDVVVKNTENCYYICKRSKDKTIAPGKYEVCGEHVKTGESDREAARRAVLEEFGIDIPSLHFDFIGYTTALDGASGHSALFLVTTNDEPKLGEEHEIGEWMSPGKIASLLRENPLQFRSNVPIHFSKHAKSLFPNSAGQPRQEVDSRRV